MQCHLYLVFLLLLAQLTFAHSPSTALPVPGEAQVAMLAGDLAPDDGFAFLQAEQANPGVVLNWHWRHPALAKYFMVERQVASGDFEVVGGVKNRDQQSAFQFTDLLAQQVAVAAYRIKAVLHDGSIQYSSVQQLRLKNLTGLQLYPNPSSGRLNLAYDWQDRGTCTIDVFDQQGRRVLHLDQIEVTGKKILFLDLETLRPGMYFLQVHSEQGDFSGKFLKQ